MKTLFSFLAIFILGSGVQALAQNFPIDPTTKKVDFVAVVPADGKTRGELYDLAMTTLHSMYKEADSKIEEKDKDNGIIVLNGFTQILIKGKGGIMVPDPALVLYKLTVSFKNGKYRYEFTNFQENRAGVPVHIETWIEHNVPGDRTFRPEDHIQANLDFVYADIQSKIKELKTGMLGLKPKEKQDW